MESHTSVTETDCPVRNPAYRVVYCRPRISTRGTAAVATSGVSQLE